MWLTPPHLVHHWMKTGGELKQAETLRQGLIQRSWRCAAYWFAPHYLLSLLS